jgi:PhzF family phenazine biosynthesis protein
MRTYPIHHIDAFTDKQFGGNPTVAVFHADTLAEHEMQLIAREMNVPETSFILKSQKADFRLRYFTRSGDEVRFCGHATVGALFALAKEGQFKVETNAGVLEMEVQHDSTGNMNMVFACTSTDFVPASYTHDQVAAGLGVSKHLLDQAKPIWWEKNNQYLYFAVPSLEQLKQLEPDTAKATEFCRQGQIIVICALTPHAFESGHHMHVRGFAPLVGIPEDPVTGSMQGGMVEYALKNHMVPRETKMIISEQGHFMQRPGKAIIEVLSQQPFRSRLHAQATHVFSSELTLK